MEVNENIAAKVAKKGDVMEMNIRKAVAGLFAVIGLLVTWGVRAEEKNATTQSSALDSNRMREGGIQDAQYEADLVTKESFSQCLDHTASFQDNYFHLVFNHPGTGTPTANAHVMLIVNSRRYAKLLEELSGPDGTSHFTELLTQLDADIQKFTDMRQGEKEPFGLMSGFPTYSPKFKDQSDLPNPLACRILVAEMLVGQVNIQAGLPKVLDAVKAMKGSMFINWSAAAYACDKTLTAISDTTHTSTQQKVHEEYMAWKQAHVESGPEMKKYFEYISKELPSSSALIRPHELAAAMGASSSEPTKKVRVEYPNPNIMHTGNGIQPPEGSPYQEVVAFAQRFVDAGKG